MPRIKGLEFRGSEASKTLEVAPIPDSLQQISLKVSQEIPVNAQELLDARQDMRDLLEKSGFHLDDIQSNPEIFAALQQPKLLRLTSGAGPVLVTALDGYSRYLMIKEADQDMEPQSRLAKLNEQFLGSNLRTFRAWAQLHSQHHPRLSEGGESSRRRGVENLLASTIKFALGEMTPEDYSRELNWRHQSVRKEEKRLKDIADELVNTNRKDTKEFSENKAKLDAHREKWGIPKPKDSERQLYRERSATFSPETMEEMLKVIQVIVKHPGFLTDYYPDINNSEKLPISVLLGYDISPKPTVDD